MVATGPVVRRRLAAVIVAFFCLFLVLAARLGYLQLIAAQGLQTRAQAQWTSESVIAPQRGSIVDRKGRVLAMSATAYIASVSPRQVKDARRFAQILAPILDMDVSVIEKRAADRSRGGATLKRQLSREIAQQLRAMAAASDDLNGLYLEEDSKRYYPMGAFASQLLGLTSIDGEGQSGLEQSLNKYLSGKRGSVLAEIDGKGRALDYGKSEYIAPVDGGTVKLTIDASIQSFVEQAAREAMTENGAKAVRVVAMDPDTGAILAMCTKPDYDPNAPPRDDVAKLTDLMRNRVIADAYEPGSTFKILTSAAALDAGVTSVGEGFYCSGSVVVEGGRIRCWGNPHGAETMAVGLRNSCNPVFVELGLRLGVERFYRYLRDFGLGSPTGVDIPGEGGGILISEAACKRVDIARIGFGQSVAVTPLQLLTAACAAINGGRLLTPYVVEEITSPDGSVLERGQTRVRATPINRKISDTMRGLLEDVVTYGGGKNAFLKGLRVGGKTGTAQVYVDGAVSSETHIGSFLGFAPMDDPQIAVLVIVDEATKRPDFGSVTAAPFARDILEKSLGYLGVVSEEAAQAAARETTVPAVVGLSIREAAAALKEVSLDYLLSGVGSTVVEQMPAAGARMAENGLVMLYVEGESREERRVAVPDVTGKTIAEANRILLSYGLAMAAEGSGVAVAQEPPSGAEVAPSTRVTVRFTIP